MDYEHRIDKCDYFSKQSFDSFKKRNLVAIIKELESKIEAIPDSIGFIAAYVMENENRICVVLKDTSFRNIQYFKENVMNSSFFEFHLGDDIIFEEEIDADKL